MKREKLFAFLLIFYVLLQIFRKIPTHLTLPTRIKPLSWLDSEANTFYAESLKAGWNLYFHNVANPLAQECFGDG